MRLVRCIGVVWVAACWTSAPGKEPLPQTFVRGDANADGKFDVSDALTTFNWLFLGGETPTCLDSADSNDDGAINITDGIFSLNYLFLGGDPTPAPGPEACGLDPTEDELTCEVFSPCVCGGLIGKACAKGQFCEFPEGTCAMMDPVGVCMPVPEACPEIYDPVCGCDGVTYSNDCERQRAGVGKSYDGPCESVCGGFIGTPCEKGQFCELPPGSCNTADMQGTCVDMPSACPDVWDPVCGCDGRTYSNDCERRAAGVQKDHDGECDGRIDPPIDDR